MRSLQTCTLALALIAGFAGVATGQHSDQAGQHNGDSVWSSNFQSNLQLLVGEWEGTCEVVWGENDASTTDLNATVKLGTDGNILLAYDSFARGRAFNGVWNWTLVNDQFSCASYDARNDWQCTFNGQLGESATQQTLTGTSNDTNYTQTLTLQNDGSLLIECSKLVQDANNQQTTQRVYRFTLRRMDEGKLSSASAYLDDAKLLAKVNVQTNTTTASVSNQ